MEFINEGVPVKIRIGEASDCYWSTINNGEKIDLPVDVGRRYGFKIITTEGQLNGKKVETKQISVPEKSVQLNPLNESNFLNELIAIKGIGKKTACDIVSWNTKEGLIDLIKNDEYLPFRDDVVDKLREVFHG